MDKPDRRPEGDPPVEPGRPEDPGKPDGVPPVRPPGREVRPESRPKNGSLPYSGYSGGRASPKRRRPRISWKTIPTPFSS